MAKSVIDKLFDLEPEIEAYVEDCTDNDRLKLTLVAVLGSITHLHNSVATEKNLGRY